MGDIAIVHTQRPPACHAGGPYTAECQGSITTIQLEGSASRDPEANAESTLKPGDIYVVDVHAANVVHLDPVTGAQTVVTARGLLGNPYNIAIEPSGTLLVVDELRASVIRIDPATGNQSVVTSGGFFVDAFDLAVGVGGDILVSDSGGGSPGFVIRVNPLTGAQTLVTIGENLVSPHRMMLDTNGDILVMDGNDVPTGGRLVRVDPLCGAQTVLSENGLFVDPYGVARDINGDFLVVDHMAFGGLGAVIRIDTATGLQSIGLSVFKCDDKWGPKGPPQNKVYIFSSFVVLSPISNAWRERWPTSSS